MKLPSLSNSIELGEDEIMIEESKANHAQGMSSIGGLLYLTNSRLGFQAHKLNLKKDAWSVRLNEIKSVERSKPLAFLNNRITVVTTAGKVEKFVVWKAGKWVRMIEGAR